MGVFSNFMPGVREVRAPLAAGGIVLLAIAIAFEPHVPDRESATGLFASLIAVKEEIGPVGQGIVVAFTAYLLGSVVQAATSGSIQRTIAYWGPESKQNDASLEDRTPLGEFTIRWVRMAFAQIQEAFGMTQAELVDSGRLKGLIFHERQRSLLGVTGKPKSPTELVANRLAKAIVGDARITQGRLLGAEPEWFSEVDRLEAEAELREAIELPLLALGAVCALRVSSTTVGLAIFAGVAAFVVALGRQGVERRRRAEATLVDAVIVGRVKPAPLERFEADLATALARAEAASDGRHAAPAGS